MLARRLAQSLRQTRAAVRLQAAVRRWLAMCAYRRARAAIVTLQKCARGMTARARYRHLVRNIRALRIQSFVRMWVVRKEYLQRKHATIFLQSCVRRKAAKKL